jgi:hypothetical protein
VQLLIVALILGAMFKSGPTERWHSASVSLSRRIPP